MGSAQGNTDAIKYEIRGTKYEVKELGATEFAQSEAEEAKPEQRVKLGSTTLRR